MALQKKFDGKTYHFKAQRRTKSEAQGVAREYRKAGNRARVSFFNNRWIIWVRG